MFGSYLTIAVAVAAVIATYLFGLRPLLRQLPKPADLSEEDHVRKYERVLRENSG